MKIGFATADWSLGNTDEIGRPTLGGAGWARIGLPAKAIGEHTEHETVVGVLVDNGSVLGVMEWSIDGEDPEVHFDCEIVVVQRYMNHNLPPAIEKAKANGQIVINDVDDWFWGLSPQNQAFKNSHPKNDSENNLNHYKATLSASSFITTSTPYLATRLESLLGTPIAIVRNALDVKRFDRERKEFNPPRIGWVGGLPWRSGDLETMQGIIGPWCFKNKWQFHHSGDYPASGLSAAKMAGIPDSVPVSTSPLVAITEYPKLFDDLNLGIVPLSYCPFNEAKSAIKGMEYAASGVPFVAADTSEYKWLAGVMNIGRVAHRPKDWVRNLEVLADPKVRAEEAKKNKEAVKRLDINIRYIDWKDTYKDAVSASL